MSIRIILFSLFTTLTTPMYGLAQEGAGYDSGVPELKVLDKFVGKWTGTLGNADEKIQATRTWALNGRFLKHEFNLSNGALSGVIYRGYDTKQERYTLTFLESNGSVSLLTGYWDEETKTLTFTAIDSSCEVQRYESYFPDPTNEQWKIVVGSDQNEINGVAKKNE